MTSIDNLSTSNPNALNNPEEGVRLVGPKGFETLDKASQLLSDYFTDKQLLASGVKEKDLAAAKRGLYSQLVNSKEL